MNSTITRAKRVVPALRSRWAVAWTTRGEVRRSGWWTLCIMCALVFSIDLVLVMSGSSARIDVILHGAIVSACDNAFFRALVLNGVSTDPIRDSALLLWQTVASSSIVLVWRRRPWSAVLLPASVGGAIGLAALLKRVIERPSAGHIAASHTYPSGHAAGTLALLLMAVYLTWHLSRSGLLRRVVFAASVIVFLLSGISILLYHYPTEVVGGYALAGAWVGFLLGVLGSRLASE